MATPIRVSKIMADSGYCARRAADRLIEAGKVTVNGRPCYLGDKADPQRDLVAVDGQPILREKHRTLYYVMLHKPRGYVTTMKDELDRKNVSQLVDLPARVYPVGRLDKNSEGLLIMTNDGALAHRLMHPSYQIDKTYRVTVREKVGDLEAVQLSEGVTIDGQKTAPATVRVLEVSPERSVMEITIHEGRNRQVRKMCEAVGLTVVRLKRNTEGPLKLGMLPPGKWRHLTQQEVRALQNAVKESAKQPAKKR